MGAGRSILITVFAHNEALLIRDCLESLPSGAGVEVHAVVNGSRDDTAARAMTVPGVIVHDYAEGGKARTWNRFLFDEIDKFADIHVFIDGDTVVAEGAIAALIQVLDDQPEANAVGGVPLNGRNAAMYREESVRVNGMFGALYAVRGSFLEQMKVAGIRLPDDVIGEDGLLRALVKTGLGRDGDWVEARVMTTAAAGFFVSNPFRIGSPASWSMQYRRMINYSVRHFQNMIISAVMRDVGARGLPPMLRTLYAEHLPRFTPRRSLRWWCFDRLALRRMRAASEQDRARRARVQAR
jgi:glycosyltransferase involved in cell wall biosynthesis